MSEFDNPHLTREDYTADPKRLMLTILAEVRALAARVDKIEKDAQDMMSPDKMMDLAGKFFGGGV